MKLLVFTSQIYGYDKPVDCLIVVAAAAAVDVVSFSTSLSVYILS